MLIAARNAMLAGGAKLPYDAEVEYLESTGTQWIDTGIVASDDVGVSMYISHMVRPSTTRLMFGVFGNTNRFGLGWNTENLFVWWNVASNGVAVPTIDDITIQLNYLNSRAWSFGSVSAGNILATYNASNTEIRLLNGRVMGGDNNIFGTSAALKFGETNISSGTAIVRNFIPVRFTNELGVSEGAMYDRVSKQLFRNAGTGAFVFPTA